MQQLSLTQNVITLFIFVMFFSACQSTVVKIPFSKDLLYDQGFSEVSIQSEQHVFYLDATANAFVAATLDKIEHKNAQIEALVRAIFDRSELNLLYQGDANTNANDTFHSQTANCLSLSIMAYALASEAGFNTYFQEIIIPEYWTRRAGFSLLNRHINIKILAPKQAGILVLDNRSYQVDFAPQLLRYQSPKKVVSKRAVLSMFYNNKGIDAFLRQDYVTAYAYFREALTVNPNFDSAWVNLGILYRLSQYFPQAEKAYQHALAIAPDSLIALENLAYLYTFTGRNEAAEKILTKVKAQRINNPYYHVNLGEQELEQRRWVQALNHFRRALALDKDKHEVYFGLARAYYEMGELQQSKRYFKQAKNKATNKHDKAKYQNKLELLNNL